MNLIGGRGFYSLLPVMPFIWERSLKGKARIIKRL